jgi:hypothetical protein
MRIGIIGTAGRRDDAPKMSMALYAAMRKRLDELLHCVPVAERHLQSGGAAWADHLAVDVFNDKKAASLTLHFPAPFDRETHDGFPSFRWNFDAGRVANLYHAEFTKHLLLSGSLVESLDDIDLALEKGAKFTVSDGFHARNFLVGQCDWLIAFTFGEGAVPKDGGTKHCWDHSPAPKKTHIPLGSLLTAQQDLF